MTSRSEGRLSATDSRDTWPARTQAGLITGLMAVVYSISHASMVTGGVAPQATATLIGMALIGTAVLCLTLGLATQLKGLVLLAQDVPAAALGAILAAIVADSASQTVEIATAQVVVLCLAAGLAFALSIYLLGSFRLAAVMRFAPRPVMAGFLAGTGLYVVKGALGICLGASLSLASLPTVLETPVLTKILVAVAVAVAMVVGSRHLKPKHAIAAVIGGSLLAFHAVVFVFGIDTQHLVNAGWFTLVPESGLPWPPIGLGDFAALDLSFVAQQIFPIFTMIVLATAALLLNLAALEAKTRAKVDLDRELRLLGLSNLAAAGLGGLPGYHAVSATLAGLRIANGHATTSLIAGVFVLLVFFFGNTLLSVLPLPVFAGFILWVGAELIRDWLFREIRVTPPTEAWLTVAIFAVVATVGLFEGTVFGLVAGSLLFIVNYSRLAPVKNELFGNVVHGSDELTPAQLKVLEENGSSIAILKMQGYVFFGTAYGLNERVNKLIQDHDLKYLILDLGSVTGVDATAVVSFKRIAEDLEHNQIEVTLAGMSDKVSTVLTRAGLPIGKDAQFAEAPDLNAALSAYETRLLAELMPDGPEAPVDIQHMVSDILQDEGLAARLVGYLEPLDLGEGDTVISEGDDASDMYILESGRVEVLIGGTQTPRRVRTLGPGAFIGEISYYCGGTRTASVRAIAPTKLWRFSSETAEHVLRADPELSSQFHAAIATKLAERITANTRLIQMLSA